MSWSFQIKPTRVEDVPQVLAEGKPQGQDFSEAQEQLKVAGDAFLAIVHSGALGHMGPDDIVFGNLYGHANPGHAETPGWSNDSVTVQVNREYPKQAE